MTAGHKRKLEELEDKLWEQFDAACKDGPSYTNPTHSSETKTSYGSPGNFTIEKP